TILKQHAVDAPMYVDPNGKPLPW
ncbi:MAG: hypothetical protein RL033_5068, partial [Pseudomonadota bacterium]